MMMASDSSHTPPSRLDDDTVNAVRVALRAYLADASASDALQGVLRRMATEAREQNILAEQLLVALKDIWAALPEVRAMTDSGTRMLLQQRVVTMCIGEYYRA